MYEEGDFEKLAPGTGELRCPVLLVGSTRVDEFTAALGEAYEVTAVSDVEAALQVGQDRDLDVLLIDCPHADNLVEFLRQSQRHCPESLRVLVIDSKDVFAEICGTNLARIDAFLLREEAIEDIGSAIDDALARRSQDNQKLMLCTDSVRSLYATRLLELEELIANRALEFAYQPIIRPATGEVFAYEALCRAKHPIFRNPQVLFDAAAQSGVLWELGRAVREVSVKALDSLPSHIKLFMNLHPSEVEDPELAKFRDGDIAKRIVFEITERASIPNYDGFSRILSGLSKNGYQFAIDDLGGGYAGLNAVALLSPDFIKIDMAMVRGIDTAPHRARLIQRIVDFANDVEIMLVAEGIETKEEAETIESLGCHLVQGYYYGRPRIGVPNLED
ncbi:MAG: EAL domain-containing protein [Myxococcales bacterium]|nr:EAL domain-containing protein [Myxococcales bacterium]